MKWFNHIVESHSVSLDDETKKKWFAENKLAHVIGTPMEIHYKNTGKKLVPKIQDPKYISNGYATVASCCGSMLVDCTIPKISDLWYKKEAIYQNIPLKKFVENFDEYTRGITIYLNNKGTVPETAETDKDVFDTFVFPDGDKITFQFRKVVEE